MLKNCVAVLDIGSSEVSLIVGQRGVNGTLNVRYIARNKYNGFAECRFFDEKNLEEAVLSCLKTVCEALKTPVDEVYVGVPGAFVRLENRKFKLVFDRKKRITDRDVEDLFSSGREHVDIYGFEIISETDIYFALDDNRKVFHPEGEDSSLLGGYLNYTLCSVYFTKIIRVILDKAKVKIEKFIFDALAESLFLIDEKSRENPSLIIDCGYITTTAAITLGNGIVAKHSEDFGGGIIAYWIVKSFDIDPETADKLQRKLNLSLTKQAEQTYKIENMNGYDEYSVEEVNAAATEAIDEFIENLEAFVIENSSKLRSGLGVYITGGGLSYIRGIREYFSTKLGVPVEILKPEIPSYSKPEEASELSELNYALDEQEKENKKRGFFGLFKRK